MKKPKKYFEEPTQFYSESDIEELYDEELNSDGDVYIEQVRFMRSKILRELDETAYNTGLLDFKDAFEQENQLWKCGTCATVFADIDDAKDCCAVWTCGTCGTEYGDEFDANECCTFEDEND